MSLAPLIAILGVIQTPSPTPWPFVIKALEGKGILGLPFEISPLPHVGFVVEVILERKRLSVARIVSSNAEVEWRDDALEKLREAKQLDVGRDPLFSLLIRQTVSSAQFRGASLSIHSSILNNSLDSKPDEFAMVVFGEVGRTWNSDAYMLSKDGTVLRKIRFEK